MLGPGLAVRVESGLEIFPSIPALLGLASLPFPHFRISCSEWQLVDSVRKPNGTGQLFCSIQGQAWWAGLRSIGLLSQTFSFLACLHVQRGYMFFWPQDRSSNVISGELLFPRQDAASRVTRALRSLLTCGVVVASSSPHPCPGGPVFPKTTGGYFSHPRSQPLRTE